MDREQKRRNGLSQFVSDQAVFVSKYIMHRAKYADKTELEFMDNLITTFIKDIGEYHKIDFHGALKMFESAQRLL